MKGLESLTKQQIKAILSWKKISGWMQEILRCESYWKLRSVFASEKQLEVEHDRVLRLQHDLWNKAKKEFCKNRDAILELPLSDRDLELRKVIQQVVDEETTKALDRLLSQD